MAENVEKRMEKTVSQYEMLRSYGIMNEDEIKAVVKKREHFTTLLERSKKEIKHYIEYLTYERNLLRTVVERKNNNLPISLETSLTSGMKIIYIQATSHFPDLIRLWDEYISFLLRSKFPNADVMAVYEEMLQFHGHEPEQWIKAVKWQRDVLERDNCTIYKPCLDLLVRALRKHPDNAYLKFELIDLELANYGRQPPSVVENRCIKIYTDDKNILQFDKLVGLLELISKYPETEEFQRCIMNDLRDKFCDQELYWRVLAKRELTGQITYKNPDMPDNNKLTSSQKMRIILFVKVYEAATEIIETKTIWSQYLDDLCEIVADGPNLIRFKRKLIGQAYKNADESSKLEERHYLQYYDILVGSKAENSIVENVLIRALDMYPDSIDLWKCKMSIYMFNESVQQLSETFAAAKKRLVVKAYPLWSHYIGYLQLMNETDLLRRTYEAVLNEHSPHFNELKAQYLEYTALLHGAKSARQIFKNALSSQTTILSMEMYNKMLEIEESQVVPNIIEWRSVLEHATTAFGKCEISLWEKYVDFEMKHGDPIRASEIITRADKTLDEKLATQFRLNRILASTVKSPVS